MLLHMPEDAELQLDSPARVEDPPDLRSDRMDSAEGGGRARGRLDEFYDVGEGAELAVELNAAEGRSFSGDEEPPQEIDDEDPEAWAVRRDQAAQQALEEAELIGFWVAWHRAGGFRGLERAGWHRTTIFRRVKRFRLHFGTHPDEMTFPWISLDLERCWRDEYDRRIRLARMGPDAPDEDR